MIAAEVGDDDEYDEKFKGSWVQDANPDLMHRVLCVTINGIPLVDLIRAASHDGSQLVVRDEKDKRRYPNKTPEDLEITRNMLIEDCDLQLTMCKIAIDIDVGKEMNDEERKAVAIFKSKRNSKWWKPNRDRTGFLFKPKKGPYHPIWTDFISCHDLDDVRANIILFKMQLENKQDYSTLPIRKP
ncbi:MAG: hypothetical protein ACOYMG_11630 [Candidatus Methylumidiphilus sp.]